MNLGTAYRSVPKGWCAALVITLAALATYANSLSTPFLFDDLPAVVHNASIRRLWPLWPVLSPPNDGSAVTARPIVNLTLSVDYAIRGLDVRPYHWTNLLIHIAAALTLFGIARRSAGTFGFVVALLWTLHPLQTESVTCVAQRTESLAGLWYYLALYCFIRGTHRAGSRLWLGFSWLSCLVGMATKEIVVTAPLAVLLYDRAFVAGDFSGALRTRWKFHLGLAATWVVQIWLQASSGGTRGGTAGFETGISWFRYLLTQAGAIVRYLRLALWPSPLVADYGTALVGGVTDVLPQVALVALLLAATVALLRWRPRWGFVGAWFFLGLAPSSSIVPLASQTMAEHRMYLPLAAVIVAAAACIAAAAGRVQAWILRQSAHIEGAPAADWTVAKTAAAGPVTRGIVFVPLIAVALAYGSLTARRNRDYRNEETFWRRSAEDWPDNPRARNNWGDALLRRDDFTGAAEQYRAASRLDPASASIRNNLGFALAQTGQVKEAAAEYAAALHLNPDLADCHNNLGNLLLVSGQETDAIIQYEVALRLKPDSPAIRDNLRNAYYDLGCALGGKSDWPAAIAAYRKAVQIDPKDVHARNNLGNALARLGRWAEAMIQYKAALQADPSFVDARVNLATAERETRR